MRKLLPLAVIATVAVLAYELAPQPAEAAPKQLTTFLTQDAGPTSQTYTLPSTEMDLCLQCPQQACFKTADAGTVIPDCTKDFVLDQSNATNLYEWCGDSAFDKVMAVTQKVGDAGTLNCVLFNNVKNRPRSPAR